MAKIIFSYLTDLYNYNLQRLDGKVPDTIQAIKTKDGCYYPIVPSSFMKGSVYIPQQGWRKIGKRKIYDIPRWDGDTQTIRKYAEEYGVDVLYHSITLGALWSRDCCDYNARGEFYSLVRYGLQDPDKFSTFNEKYKQFLALEKDAVSQIYGNDEYMMKFYQEHYSLKPVFGLFSLPMSPNVEILNAEKYLTHFYIAKYNSQIAPDKRVCEFDTDDKWQAITDAFKDKNIPEMVEMCYGKQAADLYNELEGMYSE